MKLYLIVRDDEKVDTGEPGAWVVAAEDEASALDATGWAHEDKIMVECIGDAAPGTPAGRIILANNNAE